MPVALRAGLAHEGPALLALLAVATAHLLILLLDHKTYFAQPDNSGQFWPWFQKESTALHSGALALWDGNAEAGHSFVGEIQTGVFYPLNIVWLLVLGGAHGIGTRRLDLLVVVHLLIASTGFYALARSFRVGRLAAVVAAVVFAYTGVVFARTVAQTAIFFGLALVPWAVFFTHRQLESGRLRFAAGAGVAIGLAVLAGHFEPPFHAALLVLAFYALTPALPGAQRRATMRARGKGILVTFAAAGVVALPQLLYTLPYLGRAYRFTGPGPPTPPGGSVSFQAFSEAFSAEPASVLDMLDPQRYPVTDSNELFIGLAALVALAVGVVVSRGVIRACVGRYRAPLIACALVGALAMLGAWTPFPRLLYALPLVAQVRELGRYSIMVQLVLCLLLAFSLQALCERGGLRSPESRRGGGRIAAVLGAFVIVDGVYLLGNVAPGSTSWFGVQVLLAGLALAVLALSAWRPRIPVMAMLAALIVVASLHNGSRVLGSTSSPLYPQRYFARSAALSFAEGACAGHRTLVLDEALPRNIGDVFPRLRTVGGYGATLHVPFLDFIARGSPTEPQQTRLLDIRCIIATTPVSVAGYTQRFAEPGAAGKRVYVDPSVSALNTPQLQPVPAQVLTEEDRRVRYAVASARGLTVVISAIVYPGWNVKVDGLAVKSQSYRLGGEAIFPEVTLSPGRHVVEYSWSGWPS